MKKNLLFTTMLMLMFSTAAFSQLGVKAGFALGEPLDDNTSNMHLGFDVGITYNITDNFRVEFLFETLMRKETLNVPFLGSMDIKTGIMPITVGADYIFLTDKIQPYAGLNIGVYRFSAEVFGSKDSESYFGLFPKVGASFEVADNIFIDANVKYHVAFSGNNNGSNKNTTIFGANIGLIYKFN